MKNLIIILISVAFLSTGCVPQSKSSFSKTHHKVAGKGVKYHCLGGDWARRR